MTRDSEDQLFARFRQAHDMGALAELFDRVAPQLLQIARHLVRDPHTAEDLVQQTFVAALEDQSGWDASRPVVPWLAGILANRARRAHRAVLRTPDPDRLDPASATAPEEAAIAAEIADVVRRAIEALPGTYRPVVDLHLQEGLRPREIAGRLMRPAGTIRVQLLRGLHLLRRLLPAGLTAAVLGLFAPPRGLAAIRTAVLQRAAVLTRPPQLAAGFVGVWLVGLKLWCGAGVVAAALAAWWAWPLVQTSAATAGVTAGGEPVAVRGKEPEATGASSPTKSPFARIAADTPAPAAAQPTASATGALAVRVRWGDNGEAAEGITVVCPSGNDDWAVRRSGVTGADGIAMFDRVAAGSVTVSCDRGVGVVATVPAAGTGEVEVVLAKGPPLEGVVVDPLGRPVPGAVISMGPFGQPEAWPVARTDAAGRFRLRSPGMLVALTASAPGYAPSYAVPPMFSPSSSSLRLVLGPPAELELRGVVLGIDGQPVSDARVALYRPNDTQERNWADARRGKFTPEGTRTDVAGQFRFHALTAGQHTLWARAPGTAPVSERVLIGDGAPRPLTLRLIRGATLRGKGVEVAASEPIRSAGHEPGGLRLDPAPLVVPAPTSQPAKAPLLVHIQPEHALGPDLGPTWVTDRIPVAADGTFCAPHIGVGRFRAVMRLGGQPVAEEFTALDGAELFWDLATTRYGPIAGQIVGPTGEPLVQWDVVLQPPPARITGGTHTTADKEGKFTFPRCEDVSWQLLVRPPRNGRAAGVPIGQTVRIGSTDVRLVVPAEVIGNSFIIGQLTAEPELPKMVGVIGHMVEGGRSAGGGVDAQGGFRLGPLPAGRVRLTAGNKDFDLSPRTLELQSGATVDVGVLALEPRCTLRVHVLDHEGQPVRGGHVGIRQEPSEEEVAVALVDGIGRRERVGPGRYSLRLIGVDAPIATHSVEVKGSGEVPCELRLPASVSRRVRFAAPSRAPATLTFVWREAGGRVLARDVLPWPHRDAHDATLRFVPGRFELTVTDGQGNQVRTTVDIADLTAAAQVIELRLP